MFRAFQKISYKMAESLHMQYWADKSQWQAPCQLSTTLGSGWMSPLLSPLSVAERWERVLARSGSKVPAAMTTGHLCLCYDGCESYFDKTALTAMIDFV